MFKDFKGVSDNGFQHLIAIKQSAHKNFLDIQNSLNSSNITPSKKREAGSSQAVLSEPLLQQRKSKYRILKDKFIGQQVIKVLEYLNRHEAKKRMSDVRSNGLL